MSEHLRARAILLLCDMVEGRACNSTDCDRSGRRCEAAGCDNQVCKIHENYCSGCELRYCDDCFEAHMDACCGPLTDAHDAEVEQALGSKPELKERTDGAVTTSVVGGGRKGCS